MVLLRGRDGAIQKDEDLRPKFRLRPDDYVLTGFLAVAERHRDRRGLVRAADPFSVGPGAAVGCAATTEDGLSRAELQRHRPPG